MNPRAFPIPNQAEETLVRTQPKVSCDQVLLASSFELLALIKWLVERECLRFVLL